METGLVVPPHPDAVYYAQVQAYFAFAVTLFIAGLLLIIFRFGRRSLSSSPRWPWIAMGAAACLFGIFEGVFSLSTAASPVLRLDGARLSVGGDAVTLDDSTDLSMPRGFDDPPDPQKSGFWRMPGAGRVPPFFTSGPVVWVKTSSGKVGFSPVMYGPSAYFDDNASQAATQLVSRLLASGKSGNARAWLASTFKPFTGDARPTHSFTSFILVAGPCTLVVLGFLYGTLFLKKRRAA